MQSRACSLSSVWSVERKCVWASVCHIMCCLVLFSWTFRFLSFVTCLCSDSRHSSISVSSCVCFFFSVSFNQYLIWLVTSSFKWLLSNYFSFNKKHYFERELTPLALSKWNLLVCLYLVKDSVSSLFRAGVVAKNRATCCMSNNEKYICTEIHSATLLRVSSQAVRWEEVNNHRRRWWCLKEEL